MRRILSVLVALVVLVPIAVLAIVLVLAHLQIARIEPPVPNVDLLLASVDVEGGPTRVRYVNSATQAMSDGRKMGHVGFVFDWADGRRFLIDLGMEPETAIEFGKPLETLTGSEPVVAHGAVAGQLGDAIGSLQGIAFTHLHHDHTQGIVALCRAHQRYSGDGLSIFQTPLQFDERNHTTDMGHAYILEAQRLPGSMGCGETKSLNDGPLDSVHYLPDFPGLVAIEAGGHTPGSTLYLTRIDGRYWLFSGDITNTRHELVENVPKETIYSLMIVPENTDRTGTLRRWLRELDERPDLTVVVSHDLTALEETSIPAW